MMSNTGMNRSSFDGPTESRMTLKSVLYRDFTPWNWSTYHFILGAVLLAFHSLLSDSGRVGSDDPNKLRERNRDLSGTNFHE